MRRLAPVLLYDGDCSFCTACVRWGERRFAPRAQVQPWQFADLAGLGVAQAEAEHSVVWVEPSGRVSTGSAAAARWLIAGGGRWGLLGRVALVPPVSWVAAVLYRLVAVNRHRLPGGTAACALPAAERPGARRAG